MRVYYKSLLLAIIAGLMAFPSFGQLSTDKAEITGPEKPSLSLKIVKARQYMQSVQMVFELSNRMEWLKHCWLGASFYDHDGEFLYRELPLMYTSLPTGRNQRQELWLESTDIGDIGTVVLRPMLLETALREMIFDPAMMQLETDTRYHFKVIFESEE